MLLTLFLLGLVYAVLVAVLIAAGAGAVTIAVVAALLFAVQLFTSDKIALYSMGANAFALGRSQKTATVCATTGIMDLLTPGELEAVLGHEITHVVNRDVVVMTVASFFASIAAFITQWGFFFGGGFGGDNRDNNNNNGFIFVILISAAVYVISFLLLQALSRYREFAADRGSAILTGRPSALIMALRKIDSGMAQIPTRDLRAVPGELAAFYIFPPKAKQAVTTLFSTHPPLKARIARLERLEAQLQGTA
jgi:heat shock protein HtpX